MIEFGEFETEIRALFALLPQDREPRQETLDALEELAFKSGKVKNFLRVLNDQPLQIRAYFLGRLLARATSRGILQAVEKHVRSAMAREEEAEEMTAVLEAIRDPRAIHGMLRILALTEDAATRRAATAFILRFSPEEIQPQLARALRSGDPALQGTALTIAQAVHDDSLTELLLDFYLGQVDRGDERMLLRTREALLACVGPGSVPRVTRWLTDSRAEVRSVAVAAAARLGSEAAVPGLVRLVLIDPRTRTEAAVALLTLEGQGVVSFDPGSPRAGGVQGVLRRAKQQPLLQVLAQLLQSESNVLREIGLKFLRLVSDGQALAAAVRRLADEDPVGSVRVAALEVLSRYGTEELIPTLVKILSDPALPKRSAQVVETARRMMADRLTPEEHARTQAMIDETRRAREAAYEKFAGEAESWREPL